MSQAPHTMTPAPTPTPAPQEEFGLEAILAMIRAYPNIKPDISKYIAAAKAVRAANDALAEKYPAAQQMPTQPAEPQ